MITNRQTLETALKNWLNREDSDTLERIPEFIQLAEQRIFRRLRCRTNEALASGAIAITADALLVPEPTDFAEVKIFLNGSLYDGDQLTVKTDQAYYNRDERDKVGEVSYYTRVPAQSGASYVLWPYGGIVDGDQYNLWYYQRQVLGTGGTDTTKTLTEASGLYLYGALIEAAPYLKFPEELSVWVGGYDRLFDELMADTWESELAGSTPEVSSVYGDP